MKTFTQPLRIAALAVAALLMIPNAYALDVDDEGWGSRQSSSDRYAESGSAWGTTGQTMDGRSASMAPPTLPGAPTQVPVDGGLSLLALAGAGYAASKLRRRREDEDDTATA